MDDYPNIAAAARHRDWQGCARVMFRQLFLCPPDVQLSIAAKTLSAYVKIWNEKHPNGSGIPNWIFSHTVDQEPQLPEFPEDLDPADAEFENALIEYYNGTSQRIHHTERTIHFASAIRSAVLASQINRWLHDFPDEYQRWKAGCIVTGPTFLEDDAAAKEAEIAWERIDKLLAKQRVPKSRTFESEAKAWGTLAKAYDEWENSLL